MKIVIIGPGHPLRGGIAKFNQRLASAFIEAGHSCRIVSFSLQYPSFLFPGKTQFSTEPANDNVPVTSEINSINPFNWIKVGNSIKKEKPDLVVVRYWLPFMGPALGTILRQIRKNKTTKIICLCDNAIPHEKRPGDRQFTNYFVKACDAFVTMSENVKEDLEQFDTIKPKEVIRHPVYDSFGTAIPKADALKILNLPEEETLFMFFGFIRKYKGLDILLEAIPHYKKLTSKPFKLIIAGEFYADETSYLNKIKALGIENDVLLHTHFIPDSQVKNYFSAADVVIQPYLNATQSGITPLCYHFDMPMIVSDVKGLTAFIQENETGHISPLDPEKMAQTMLKFTQNGKAHYLPYLKEEKKNYSWEALTNSMLKIVKE